jgi:drug/metabolite transporter (DMT)-like permease
LPYLALAALALIWGASFLFIKVAVQDMAPTTLVLVRTVSGSAVLLLVFAASRRAPLPAGTRRRVVPFFVMAVFSSVIPWLGFGYGEQSITSALASIINATTPLWTAIFAYWVIPQERLSPLNYAGVGIGFVGTAIVLAPDLVGQPLRATTFGSLIVVAAAASYAVAALYQRRKLKGVSPLEASLGQMLAGTLIMIPLAAPSLGATHLRLASAGAALALGIGGSGVAYILYYYVLNSLGATRATTVTLLLPLTAVFWGATILHEPITLPILVGMAVILIGVTLTSRPARRRPATVDRGAASAAS